MPSSVKSLGYIKCYTQVAPDLLIALAIISDTTVRRSAVDREDLMPYWKSEKRPHFSRQSSFQRLTTERRLTMSWFLVADLSPTFLNTGTTHETCLQFRKQDSFRHILKSSPSMYETSGSQIFRITTGIQSGPNQIKYNH